jgi:hypothetical protein
MSSDPTEDQPLERALGPSIGPWTLLRWASAVLVLASLAGVVTRWLPPAEGRAGDESVADARGLFFLGHAAVWALVFLLASRRARRRPEGG